MNLHNLTAFNSMEITYCNRKILCVNCLLRYCYYYYYFKCSHILRFDLVLCNDTHITGSIIKASKVIPHIKEEEK